MNDNPVTGLVTAAVIAPVVAVCCLGPAVLGSLIGGAVGWIGGLGPAEAAGTAVAAGVVAYALRRWYRARRRQGDAAQACRRARPAGGHDGRVEAPPPKPAEWP